MHLMPGVACSLSLTSAWCHRFAEVLSCGVGAAHRHSSGFAPWDSKRGPAECRLTAGYLGAGLIPNLIWCLRGAAGKMLSCLFLCCVLIVLYSAFGALKCLQADGQFRKLNTHSNVFHVLCGCFPHHPNETQPWKLSASCRLHPASSGPHLPGARKTN